MTAASIYVIGTVACVLFLHSERETNVALVLGLLIGYGLVSRVRFEFGGYYNSLEQVVYIPALLLAPLQFVPVIVAGGAMLASLPEFREGSWHRDRWVDTLADSLSLLAPVAVVAALAPGPASLGAVAVYVLALFVQAGTDAGWTVLRNRLLDQLPLREVLADCSGTTRMDALLTPIGFVASIAAVGHPLLLVAAIAPFVVLLEMFSRDRHERFAATIDLNRAYRGTVMLLSDVIETDDPYTADHSRSVVELAGAVAGQLQLDWLERQKLEFAAMLHDVGKIAIPSDILNKPAALTAEEFEHVKTHVIEGQYMLDRVGGLLGEVGEVVRSCHERWDGRGYPDGLKGAEIPLAARIVFACDAYSAITTDRPYRTARSRDRALAELTRGAGSQFDPRVVAALIEVIESAVEPLPIDDLRALLATRPVARNVRAAV